MLFYIQQMHSQKNWVLVVSYDIYGVALLIMSDSSLIFVNGLCQNGYYEKARIQVMMEIKEKHLMF